jgi:Ca2+/Na+ antiporter
MKLNPIALGNALGAAMALLFLVCGLLVFLSPAVTMTVYKSIAHGLDVSSLAPASKPQFEAGTFCLGVVFMSASSWLFGWLSGTIYNASNRNRS